MREIKLPGGVTLFQQQAESDSELSRDPLSGNSQPHKHQQTEQTAQQWYEMSGVTRRCRDHAECRAYRTHIFVSGPATDRIKRPCVTGHLFVNTSQTFQSRMWRTSPTLETSWYHSHSWRRSFPLSFLTGRLQVMQGSRRCHLNELAIWIVLWYRLF